MSSGTEVTNLLKATTSQLRTMNPQLFEKRLREMTPGDVKLFVRMRNLSPERLKICEAVALARGFELYDRVKPSLLPKLKRIATVVALSAVAATACAGAAVAIGEYNAKQAADMQRRLIDIPGGSAWIYVGRWENGTGFAEGPGLTVKQPADGERRFPVQAGDAIELSEDKRLYIVDFARSQTARVRQSPAGKWRMESTDEVGLTAMPKVGFRVEELSLGRARQRSGWDVWARITRPGQRNVQAPAPAPPPALALEKSGR